MGLVLLPFAILPWVVFCAAAGLVAAAALGGTANYIKSVVIGVVVGIVCGLIRLFAINSLGYLLDTAGLQPSDVLRDLPISLASILITTGFAAATGAAVAGFVAQSRGNIRYCAMVSGGYGLLIGVAGMVVGSVFRYGFLLDLEDRTFADPQVITYVVVAGGLDVGVKAALTVVAFVWVRRKRLAS